MKMDYDVADVDRGIDLAWGISNRVNVTCEFIDLENYVCRYVEAGLVPGRYEDSVCPACLKGLEYIRVSRALGLGKKV